jgi:hypothetical protein
MSYDTRQEAGRQRRGGSHRTLKPTCAYVVVTNQCEARRLRCAQGTHFRVAEIMKPNPSQFCLFKPQ